MVTATILKRLATLTLIATVVVIAGLSLAASPRRTGDAHQYIAMALQLSRLHPPSLASTDATDYQRWLETHPAETGFPDGARAIHQPALVRDGRQEFSHFWLYPLLVAPALGVTSALGTHPLAAFSVVNGLLLGAAVLASSRVFGVLATIALVASPLVWFVGRAQVEVFTVSLLTLAIAAAGAGRWGWASIAAAVAATQNIPIAAMVPLFWSGAVIDWRVTRHESAQPVVPDARQMGRVATFVIAGIVIAMAHPVYYLFRLGVVTPQQLNGGVASEWPSLQRLVAPLVDPDIGLFAWVPVTVVVAVAGAAMELRRHHKSGKRAVRKLLHLICAAIMALWLLVVFAQTTNVNSGGTIYISRYALWLLPLMLPALSLATQEVAKRASTSALIAVVALFALYLAYFHPDQPERYVVHSPQATWLMTHFPAVYHPLPEIFVERTRHVDGGPRVSATSPDCRIIFLLRQEPEQPCALTEAKRSAADELYRSGSAAVWIRRGTGGASVTSPALLVQ